MTRYMEILANQSTPTDIGLDAERRAVYSLNFRSVVNGQPTDFEREIAKIISDASLGTLGTDMTIGNQWTPPQGGAGPYVRLISSGGREPLETHGGSRYERPSIQILVSASNPEVARDRALAILRALDGQRKKDVVAP